jgi:N utilization substance protein B
MVCMSLNKINNKTISRIAAIQTLYQYGQKDQDHNVDLLLQEIIVFYQNQNNANNPDFDKSVKIKIKPSVSYLITLVKTTIENIVIIDQLISAHLTDEWTIESLPPLLFALLRVSICELKFFPETPRKVVIHEFTDITSDMLNDNEVGFVNGILDVIANGS